ncbi:hypothetical protein ABG067_006380 [Albugo candida]
MEYIYIISRSLFAQMQLVRTSIHGLESIRYRSPFILFFFSILSRDEERVGPRRTSVHVECRDDSCVMYHESMYDSCAEVPGTRRFNEAPIQPTPPQSTRLY